MTPLELELVTEVVAIHAYDDGILGHGLTHKVTLLSRQADGPVQALMELTVADPQIHEALVPGQRYLLTLAPLIPDAPHGRPERVPQG